MSIPDPERITFVVAVKTKGEILKDNFLASPCFQGPHDYQIIIQQNFVSAARAYNDAIDRAANDIIVFAHQDVIFPKCWPSELARAIECLEIDSPQWGVLGCYGVTRDHEGRGFIYSPGHGILGAPLERPAAVQTLDEVVLILRKSSRLRFDAALPHFHLYGTDICLRAAQAKLNSYAISAFCIHNADHYTVLPREFYECCNHIKATWRFNLPIQTTCIRITRFDIPLYLRRLRDARVRWYGRGFVAPRVKEVASLLEEIDRRLDGR